MIKINSEPLNVTMFPDNTSQVWKLDDKILTATDTVVIDWDYSSEGEFMHLAQLKELFDYYDVDCVLNINYLPYARQDKKINNNTTFALHTFSRLLNFLNFSRINILDPHSKDALQFIRNSKALCPTEKILQARAKCGACVLFYPDEGAKTRYSHGLVNAPYTYADKVRDQVTGNIISYSINGDHVARKDVLIVDDICDGGATFIVAAKALLKNQAKSVSLYVTHGIFSKGTDVLFNAGISRIFTKDGEITRRTLNQQL